MPFRRSEQSVTKNSEVKLMAKPSTEIGETIAQTQKKKKKRRGGKGGKKETC
jgi:hypothetical protein